MSLNNPEVMALDVSSNQGAKVYRVELRVIATAGPTTDTIFDVAEHLAAFGYFDGAPLSANPAAICQGIQIRIGIENRKNRQGTVVWYWPATATFSTRTALDPAALQAPDPVDRPVRISFRHEDYTMPVLKDENDQPVTNSADDPVRRDVRRARTILVLDKAVSTFNPVLLQEQPDGLKFSRNLDDWHPFGPYESLFGDYVVGAGTGFMAVLTSNMGFENGNIHLDLHAEVAIDERDEHKDKFWDEGYRTSQPPPKRQIIQNGAFPTKPVHLDGAGAILPTGDPPEELEFQYYKAMSWASLPF